MSLKFCLIFSDSKWLRIVRAHRAMANIIRSQVRVCGQKFDSIYLPEQWNEPLQIKVIMCRVRSVLDLYLGIVRQVIFQPKGQLWIRGCCYGWDHTARSLSLAKGSVKMCTWFLFLAREFSNPGMITWRITNQSDAWVQSLIRDGLLI